MTEEETKSLGSSTSSEILQLHKDIVSLKEELNQKDKILEFYNQRDTMSEESTYRIHLINNIAKINQSIETLAKELGSMSKRISNQNRILAAHLNVEVE